MYTLLLAIIYLIFISLGLPDSLLGAGWPTMRLVFHMPTSAAGIISMIVSGGTIVSSLMSERMTKKTSTELVTITSVLLTAAALFGFSVSTRFWMLCLWAIPYGLGAGAIDSAINNYVALHYSSRHMSWLHCFWGIGTIISPCIMSFALTHYSWSTGYRIISFIQLGIVIILVFTLKLWKVNKKAAGEKEPEKILGIKGALKTKGAVYLFAGFFSYCAAEGTAMLWASSYLTDAKGISAQVSAAFASLFFIGITLGRFISGFISDKLGDLKMIRLGTSVAFAGIVCIFLSFLYTGLALAGLIIFGMGCAPVYPSIIHSTPANFGAEKSQGIIGIQMASAYVGSTFMPPLFGLLANHISLNLFPFFLLFFLLLMIAMIEKTYRKVNPQL